MTTEVDTRAAVSMPALMGAVVLGAIMIQLDATMTNVAYNTLLTEFHTTLLTVQWVGTGYLLAMTAVMALSGWSLARFGGRTMWTVCITVFLGGSILCGAAWSAESLVLFRVLQGLGAGMILPLGMAVLAQAAEPGRLGRAMAVMGIPAALGPVLGPVLGGIIVNDLSWRWIFSINVPVCVVAIVIGWRAMPSASGRAAKLDVLGLALLTPACAVLIYGMNEAGRYGTFGDWHVFVPLAAGVVLLLLFVLHALRTKVEPIVDLRLLRIRSFTSATFVLFVASAALFGANALLPLYFQQARGYSALQTGSLLIPQGVGMGIALFLSGRLADRFGARTLVLAGLGLTGAGSVVFTQLGADTSYLLLGAALLLSGGGVGAVMAPAMAGALRDIRPGDIPQASAGNRIIMQLGASLGGALLLIILQGKLNTAAPRDMAAPAEAYGSTFWWILGCAAVAALIAVTMPTARSETTLETTSEDT